MLLIMLMSASHAQTVKLMKTKVYKNIKYEDYHFRTE